MNVDMSDEQSEEFVQSIGRIILLWNVIELHLDLWTAFAHDRFGGDKIEKKRPRNLSRKVDFLRKCATRLLPLSPFKSDILGYLKRVDDLSETRHYAAHGIVTFEGNDIRFMKIEIDRKQKRHTTGELVTTQEALHDAGDQFQDLSTVGQALTDRLLETVKAED